MTPQYRQWLYTAAAVASALIPILVAYNVIETDVAGAWINLIGVLGGLGTVGASTAAVMTARQRKDGTLDFTGTPAQQAIDAIQATVSQAGTASGELQRVITAATDLIATGSILAAPVVEAVSAAVASATSSDPASADYQP
jgi:hypothetical protein